MADRTTVSGMSIVLTLSLYGTAPIHLLQLPRAAQSWRGPSRVHMRMISDTLLEFSPCCFVIFAPGRQMRESGSLKAGVPHEQRLVRKPVLEPTPCLPHCSLSPCVSVRNPDLCLLSDHIFCFAADRATMKRPQSSLFCMQASTGYVEDELAPLWDAGILPLALPPQ